MKMKKLRPIGSTFEIEYPPAQNSTDYRWSRHTVKVVGHVEAVINRRGDTILAEEIRCIKIECFEKPLDNAGG